MGQKISYTPPQNVCSSLIEIEVEDGVIISANITDGCMGNTHAVAALAVGMSATDVISRLEGVACGGKKTSCPDQFAKALRMLLSDGEGAADNAKGE